MARSRKYGAWRGRKKRITGDFAHYANGQIFVPERKITHVAMGSRYCALPLRGYGHVQAVVDTTRHRAIGFVTTDSALYNTVLRRCDAQTLDGARRRRRR